MDFDEWCATHGVYLNDRDDAAKAAKLMARAAWNASAAAERERMLSVPNLMHACDALGAPADGEHCELLRRALYRA